MILHGNIKDRAFDAILFDFDGVIADTEAVFAQFDCDLLNEVLQQAGKEPHLTPPYMRCFAGMSSEEKLEKIAQDDNFSATHYKEAYIRHRNSLRPALFKDNTVPPSPGLIELLGHYQDRYALATNKTRDKIEGDISSMALSDYFGGRIFCYEKGLKKKPAPDILLHAASSLAIKPELTVYVGDNEDDMIAAKAAGMIAAGFVCPSFEFIEPDKRARALMKAGADFIVDDLSDLSPPFTG